MKRLCIGLAALLLAGLAEPHPLGNNTVSRQAAIEVARQRVTLRYRLDLAEIPTLLAAQDADADADGTTTTGEWGAYARRRGDEIRDAIELRVDARQLPLAVEATHWQRVAGAAGLDTWRFEARLGAALDGSETARLEYRDHRRPDEAGWKEVVATTSGKGVRLTASDVPRVSPSADLTAYPVSDAASEASLPDQLSARIEVAMAPIVAPAAATGPVRAMSSSDAAATVAVATSPEVVPVPAAAPAPAVSPKASAAPPPPASPLAQVGAFFRLGAHHIATGWDHLVFLLGLIVAQKSLRRLVWVITAFTAAHSLTLGLAAAGLVTPPANWVEPAIALTIAYVGLGSLTGRLRHGAAIAFAFGLVHGFGFAGALAESLHGAQIGGSGWLFDLAAFNLGIEVVQLALILTLLPLIALMTRRSWSAPAHQAASIAVLGAGLGWFFSRI